MPPLGPLGPGNPSPAPRAGTCRTARAGAGSSCQSGSQGLSGAQGKAAPDHGHLRTWGSRGAGPWPGHASQREAHLCAGRRPGREPGPRAGPAASSQHPLRGGGRRPQGRPLWRDLSLQEPFVAPELAPAPVASRGWVGQGCGSTCPGKQWALALGWPQPETARGGHVCQVGPGSLRAPQVLASGILLLGTHPRLALSTLLCTQTSEFLVPREVTGVLTANRAPRANLSLTGEGLRGCPPRDRTLPHHAAPSPVLPGALAVRWHLAPPRQWGASSQMESHVGPWS